MSLPPPTTPSTPHSDHAQLPRTAPPPHRTETRHGVFPSPSHPVTASLPSFPPTSSPFSNPSNPSLATLNHVVPTPTTLPSNSHPKPAFPGQIFPAASTSTRPPQTPVSAEEARLVRQDGVRKRRWNVMGFKPDEQEVIERRANEIHLALALDQEATLYPEAAGQGGQSGPKRFRSHEDVVDRLLPWHVWQIHDEELEGVSKGLKKDKIREQRELAEVTALAKRISAVHDRFAIARWRAGTHDSDLPSLINIFHTSTSDLREEKNSLDDSRRDVTARWTAMESERLRKERVRVENARISAATANAAATPKFGSSARPAAPTPPTPVRPPTPIQAPRPDSSALPGNSPSHHSESNNGKPRGRPRGKGRDGLRETVLALTTTSTSSKTSSPLSSPTGTNGKSFPVSAKAPKAATNITASTTNTPSASTSKVAISNGGPSGSTRSSAATTGTPPLGPVSITVSVALVSGFMKLGVLAPANKTAPGKVVRTSDDKKSLVLSIDLAACTQPQLQGLAKLLNVSAKPAGMGGGGAAGQIADAAENSRVQTS